MASRALRIWERHGRFGCSPHRFVVSSNPRSPIILGAPHLSSNAGGNVGFLVVLRRDVSSTGQQMQQVPSEIEEGEKKKPILGLNFLSKFFGRTHEPPAAAVEAEAVEAVEADPAEAENPAFEEGAAVTEFSEVEAAAEDGQMLEAEAAMEEGQMLEAEAAAAEESQALQPAEEGVVEAAVEEGQLIEEGGEILAEESSTVVLESEPAIIQQPPVERKSDIAVSVEELIKALPPLPAAVEAAAPVAPKTVIEQPKAVEEKPTSVTEKPKAVEEKPKSVQKAEKAKAAQEKPKAVAPALKKLADSAASASPASEKKTSASKKPADVPSKVSTADKSTKPADSLPDNQSPVFEFLRSKIRENDKNVDVSAAAEKVASSKPSLLKPSPRFEALSSQSNAEKTTAAINKLLDTVDKSAKSPAAPIFDALDALNVKEESKPPPSLRLSLSAAHSEPAPMDAKTLMLEMNTRLTDEKITEAVALFETWRSSIDPRTLECNKPDRTLYNLYMQAKLKAAASYEELHEVVSEMEEAGIPRDLAGYNILIRALFRKQDSATAEKLLERMEKEEPQAQPDGDSYNLVVVLCALDRKVSTATKYMKTMIEKGFEPSRTTMNEVLLASARSHQTQLGASLLKESKLPLPMLNTCAELLMAASEIDDAECSRLALASIAERPMARYGPKFIFDEGTLICVLGTAARTGDTALCKNAWEAICTHTRAIGTTPSPEAFLARIHALALSGDISTAFKALWEFELNHGRKGDANPEAFSPFTSLRSLASACSRGGLEAVDAAYYLLLEDRKNKQGVALAAINCIIMGCANIWSDLRAYETFEAIEADFGLRPDIHTCNALIHTLGRTKHTADALKVYDFIKECGFKPDVWTYTALSDAHLVNQDPNAALDVLQNMIEAGLQPMRQTTLKVWTRCKQREDNDAMERLRKMESDLNYRPCYVANARRKLLLEVIKS